MTQAPEQLKSLAPLLASLAGPLPLQKTQKSKEGIPHVFSLQPIV